MDFQLKKMFLRIFVLNRFQAWKMINLHFFTSWNHWKREILTTKLGAEFSHCRIFRCKFSWKSMLGFSKIDFLTKNRYFIFWFCAVFRTQKWYFSTFLKLEKALKMLIFLGKSTFCVSRMLGIIFKHIFRHNLKKMTLLPYVFERAGCTFFTNSIFDAFTLGFCEKMSLQNSKSKG